MKTETDSSHLTRSLSSSSLPRPQPQNPVDNLSSNDSSTQGLQNEGMTNNGFQIPSSDDFYSCIVFNINQLKNILLSRFNPHEPDNIARKADEELSKAEATTDSDAQPQHGGSYIYETWPSHVYQSIPCHEDQTLYTIEESAHMISRKPFEPIGRPFNPFGPIERPIPRLPYS